MLQLIDSLLDRITMYRLVLYYLIILLGIAGIFCLFHILPYSFVSLALSVIFFLAIGWITNTIFARVFEVPTNVESVYISVLILALIITPIKTADDIIFFGWVAVWTMASKFIVAIHRKHLFNPVAFAVALMTFTIGRAASWWIGTGIMMPFVLIGGLLVVRKIRRWNLVFSFFLIALLTLSGLSILRGADMFATLQTSVLYSPLLFFAFIMLTEPLTTPPTDRLQIYYGALVGFLFPPQMHVGPFFSTPELSLLVGNVFSYIVSPKSKLLLTLQEKVMKGEGLYDFIFRLEKKFPFIPGQYMEWTLPHQKPDTRGNRRYFTIASSPTEDTMRIGVKFYPNSSSFKKALFSIKHGDTMLAGQLAGDFVLPKDSNQRLVFIAGSIGITPFRSIIQYLLDVRQKRPITLLYSNKTATEIIYQDVFARATQELGIKTVYTITDTNAIPAEWAGRVGRVDEKMIREEIPDYKNCMYYLSGPHAMVTTFERVLRALGVSKNNIKIDFFPGFV